MTPGLILLLVLVGAVVCVVAGFRLAGHGASRRARGRNRVAQRGEREAIALLELAGYTICGRGVTRQATLRFDGEPLAFGVCADLVARCPRGRLHVVEVKTGDLAPDPRHGPTRRQLLEYSLIFGTPHLLLVDMQAGEIHEVGFEGVVPVERVDGHSTRSL
jgi:hypothetical protein